jgi:AraC family transcriptional regulator
VFAFYDGWLKVERSMLHAADQYVTENMLCFPGGWIERRHIKCSRPVEGVCTTTSRCYLLNLSVSGWVMGGSAKSLPSGQRRDAETLGSVWLIPPEQTVQFNATEFQSRSIRCALDAKLFESLLGDAPRWDGKDDGSPAPCNISGGEIEWIVRRMDRELRNADFATLQLLEALAKQLAVEIIRTLKWRPETSIPSIAKIAPWRLRLIRNRIWSEKPLPDIEELAKLCDITVRHLSRTFRGETGMTLGEQIEIAMVDRAKTMLRRGMAVREVAKTLGYATSTTFASAFRRATGMRPSEIDLISRKNDSTRTRRVGAISVPIGLATKE